jgi:hypothetical protein
VSDQKVAGEKKWLPLLSPKADVSDDIFLVCVST